ncbi:Hsp70 family protein [Haematobacter genomosp. 1]|uniref:Hsp70 family protein n=1 Tax=Haematobacter genomosp. 1 TaxID=366618 RepID=A0A212AFA5_9RHOB|nr:Hsp70 family protein [Haematobacter genomosp. 1]OWJ80119.1 hsp70 family protein [Haematobacter genomosp. 1]
MPTLAIDFGTSNSAVAILTPEGLRRLPLEADSDTLPTAVFFPARGGAMKIGEAAGEALIAGEEGRYMRALKSVLGTALFHDSRLIGGRRRTLADVVTAFLSTVKERAEADLAACYAAAGFTSVRFMPEPEAAALSSHGLGATGKVGLVVDIGGGTSDFSVYRMEDGRLRILASHGIRLGGTDFDESVSLSHAMPELGHGSSLRREIGPGTLPMPNALYVDLATWSRIPFVYTPENRREVARMVRLATEPEKLERLSAVLEEELGHELAFAVEHGKIAANGPEGAGVIDMGMIERGLAPVVTGASLDKALENHRAELARAAADTLHLAGIAPESVGTVILVGGSSLMRLVAEEARRLCPAARIERSHAFTAVVDGLALALAEEPVA